MTEDPRYGPNRYKDIVKERYIISKHTNTSYEGTSNISPTERTYLLEFIQEDLQRQKDIYDKIRANSQK